MQIVHAAETNARRLALGQGQRSMVGVGEGYFHAAGEDIHFRSLRGRFVDGEISSEIRDDRARGAHAKAVGRRRDVGADFAVEQVRLAGGNQSQLGGTFENRFRAAGELEADHTGFQAQPAGRE